MGDPTVPTGRLVVNTVFPAFGVGEEADALSVVESDRANAQIAGPGVFELPLDTAGFIESSRSLAELFVRPDLAVSLQWSPLDAPARGRTRSPTRSRRASPPWPRTSPTAWAEEWAEAI